MNGVATLGTSDQTAGFGAFQFTGTETLAGNGSVVFGNDYYSSLGTNELIVQSASTTLTIGQGITIEGTNGVITGTSSDVLANLGTIIATASGSTIVVSSGQVTNQGTIAATGGVAKVSSSQTTNQGTIKASGGGSLSISGLKGNLNTRLLSDGGSSLALAGTGYVINQGLRRRRERLYRSAGHGAIRKPSHAGREPLPRRSVERIDQCVDQYGDDQRERLDGQPGGAVHACGVLGTFVNSGSSVNVTGTLNDAGVTLAINAATGSWSLAGGTIKGGTYTSSGGNELIFTSAGGTLDGVTANANLDLSQGQGVSVTIVDGLTLNGTAELGSSDTSNSRSGSMIFSGSETLAGTGIVLMAGGAGSGGNSLSVRGAGSALSIGSAIAISVANGSISCDSGATLTTSGNITAALQDASLAMNINGALVNHGTIAASAGRAAISINVTGSLTNQGAITANTAQATVTIGGNGSLTNQGTLQATAGQLSLN